jgi:XTP/dITP diphosphohydrolase
MKILIATANRGKLTEIRAILGDLDGQIVGLDEIDAPPPVAETGLTFLENARLKARYYAAHSGLISIADDSGLCVTALGDRPGVFSARFAGPDAADAENNELLLAQMRDVADRRARFVCVTVCAKPSGEYIAEEGSCDGVLLDEPRGFDGFGYDPLFFVPEYNLTFAEMPRELKNRISHRARSLVQLKRKLPDVLAAK